MIRNSRQVLTELLVLKAQGGDECAFADLYALWATDLHRLALVQLEQTNHAEEVTQDAWVTIARSLPRLNDPACFPRWSFRILERRCADWIRRQQTDRKRKQELEADISNKFQNEPTDDSEEIVTLQEVINRLCPENRKLLHLYYETGLSITEIAEILDLPSGTIKSRLHTTRERLKHQIERINHE